MARTLKAMPVGATCTVLAVSGEGRVRRRLFDMGVTPGTVIQIVRVAPLGDPIEISIRGYALTLRKAEAQAVEVEVGDTSHAH